MNTQDAETIRDYVESRGFKCWMAPRDVPAGANYATQIVKAIRQCDAMIVIVSKNLCNSGHATNEISIAFDKNKIIIPFLIEDIQFPDELIYYLNRKHWIHYQGNYRKSLPTLVEDLANWITPSLVKKHTGGLTESSQELTGKPVQDTTIKNNLKINKTSLLNNYHCPEEAYRLGRLFESVDCSLARRYYNHAIALGYDLAHSYLKKMYPNDLGLSMSQRSQLFEQLDEEKIVTADFLSYKSFKDAIMKAEQMTNRDKKIYCYIQAFAIDHTIANFILNGIALPPFSEDSDYDYETLVQIINAIDKENLKKFVSEKM